LRLAATGGAALLPLVFFRSRLFGRFTVSMPFLNYGGVVSDAAEARRALVDRAVEETEARGGAHLELRHTAQLFPDFTAKRHKVAMRLPLASDPERLWAQLDRKVRNQVRKGEKSQLEVAHGGAELVDDFYAVFAHNMRDLGTPVYARSFFDEVLRTFADSARIFVVRHAGRPVAGSIVYWHRSMIEVPWASALRESNPLCANVLLYWHMLKFAVERGFTVFDFGRSTPDEGTFHFKRQWGAEPLELPLGQRAEDHDAVGEPRRDRRRGIADRRRSAATTAAPLHIGEAELGEAEGGGQARRVIAVIAVGGEAVDLAGVDAGVLAGA